MRNFEALPAPQQFSHLTDILSDNKGAYFGALLQKKVCSAKWQDLRPSVALEAHRSFFLAMDS